MLNQDQKAIVRPVSMRSCVRTVGALAIGVFCFAGIVAPAAKETKTIVQGLSACFEWCREHNKTTKSRDECENNCSRYWACNGSDSTPSFCKSVLESLNSAPAKSSTAMPRPILQYMGWEEYQIGGVPWVRYKLSVVNRSAFDPVLFAPASNLPPCGTNTNASRAWVAVHDFNRPASEQIYGFCALQSNNDLGALWFAAPRANRPAWQVFITIDDRFRHNVVRSNVVQISRPSAPTGVGTGSRPPVSTN